MAYFDKAFLEFFRDLAANNHRDWFHKHKKHYEKVVKAPFANFVTDLIEAVKKEDPILDIDAKQAIFRIYRDVRFSKDKTPYKTNVSAVIAPGGRKEMAIPGMYIQLDVEHVRIYGGVYMPNKHQLEDIRYAIANDMNGFKKLVEDKNFINHYEEISGEKYKRLPKDWQELAEEQPLLYNKQFYFFAKLDPESVLRDDFMELVIEYYRAGLGIRDFFRKALGAQEGKA
jgi:uncharacterized protein (TIGR02453 family)